MIKNEPINKKMKMDGEMEIPPLKTKIKHIDDLPPENLRFLVRSTALTDGAIVFLIDRCKSLVSLDLDHCSQITGRTLEAVVAEVRRRHRKTPRLIPTDPHDNRIFFFAGRTTEISYYKLKTKPKNPWLTFDFAGVRNDPRKFV